MSTRKLGHALMLWSTLFINIPVLLGVAIRYFTWPMFWVVYLAIIPSFIASLFTGLVR